MQHALLLVNMRTISTTRWITFFPVKSQTFLLISEQLSLLWVPLKNLNYLLKVDLLLLLVGVIHIGLDYKNFECTWGLKLKMLFLSEISAPPLRVFTCFWASRADCPSLIVYCKIWLLSFKIHSLNLLLLTTTPLISPNT